MAEYLTEDGQPLVVSASYVGAEPFLTVPAYLKWYTMYVVDPRTGTVRGVGADEYPGNADDHWRDHCVIPKSYRRVAEHLGVRAIDIAYEVIVGRFLNDILDGDPRGLADYLDDESP